MDRAPSFCHSRRMTEAATDLRARVIRAAEAFILNGKAAKPKAWDDWFVIVSADDEGDGQEPDLVFPRSTPAAFPDFARDWLRSTSRL